MVTAFVMMKTDPHRIPESAQDIANIEEVQAVYSVTGKWDLVAMVKTPNLEDLSDLVPAKIAKVATVHDTETMVAFRTYSDQELEASFSLGGE
ncbi:Lrp/AsnC family transcriptional regulator [Nesterenkonia halotolerans]|uniref:DNA-binding Lrp family transcriptional regulator n=1 Tax=Nesterenkonia halotolerans TaxID=225325 RepID=A0ABR9J8A9_9MICC|nr:Lrp/AsnC ligand binding domain-containing protein [Nesterenkonia halotolerans]MBE1515239.1 DNA-binding Lrp family transcriptional regulator [Nesterenkonia halotolerans]